MTMSGGNMFGGGGGPSVVSDATGVTLVAPSLGISTSATAIANANAMQAALTAGGDVRWVGNGTVYVDATKLPFVIGSNTSLQVDSTLIIRQANGVTGTTNSLLVSSQFVRRATGAAVTISWTAGNTCSLAWTAHGLVAGDYVWVQGAAPSAFNGIFVVKTVTNANAVVIILYRNPPENAAFIATLNLQVLNVQASSISQGGIEIGQVIGGSGVAANTIVTQFLTGTGGPGTYLVSVSQVVGTEAMTATSPSHGGAATAMKADVNVFIQGGVWDYDHDNNQSTAGSELVEGSLLYGFGMILAGQNLHLRDMVIKNCAAQTFILGACRDYSAENISAPVTSSGGWQIHGPALNGYCRNFSGYGGDDGFAIDSKIMDDYKGYRWTYGDLIDLNVENVHWDSAVGGAFLLYASVAEKTDNITLRHITGSNLGASLYGTSVFFWNAGDHIGRVVVEDVNCNADAGISIHSQNGAFTGSLAAGVLTVASGQTGNPVEVGNVVGGSGVTSCVVTAQLTGATPGGAGTYSTTGGQTLSSQTITNSSPGIIDDLTVRGLTYNPQSAGSSAFFLDALSTIRNADIHIVSNVPAPLAGAPYLCQLGGIFGTIKVKLTVPTLHPQLIRGISLTATAVGGHLIIQDSYCFFQDILLGLTGGVSIGKVTFLNNTIDAPAVTSIPDGTFNIAFIGNKINAATLGMYRHGGSATIVGEMSGNVISGSSIVVVIASGSANFTLRSDGTNIQPGTWFSTPADTPVIKLYGWDIAVDPIALNGLAVTKGQYIQSTRASAVNQGPAVAGDGAHWIALATGALGVNTVIT